MALGLTGGVRKEMLILSYLSLFLIYGQVLPSLL